MRRDDPHTVSDPLSAVLLVFMPSAPATHEQRKLLVQPTDSVQGRFQTRLRVLRIDATNHPHVVHCFAVTLTPTFVLVREGLELWRQEGLPAEETLVSLIQDWLTS